ncbi:hypothetical protein O9X90_26490 [Agrobacterium leguminum]|jgi:hypothetical protein|uniref:hypothetical protein n=1 Tax=Agrobacterium TaxID=357 RepID=UPI0022B853A6|nr:MULTISPECIES: hypothetical protein [Agrobacterium]MCZ7935878.1 hypothetical protein [Agrobacterium leguminum]MCZ7977226.1 hypothetical protein [Agrobacterium salinitolerans]
MALNKPSRGAVLVAAIAFLTGTTGGYAINEMIRSDRETDLEHEVARLKGEASQDTKPEVPSDEEASAALAKSGRSMRISECKPRQAVPGVTCSGMIMTTAGSFAGTSQPGVLSFAKIDGVWRQIQ